MDKTTIHQRLEFASQFDEVWKLDAAHNLLSNLYDEIYGLLDAEVGPYEKDKTASTLIAAQALIYDVMAALYQCMGKTDYRGGSYQVEQAARLQELHKVEELYYKATDRSRRQGWPDKLQEKIRAISELPDAEAIPALEALLAE